MNGDNAMKAIAIRFIILICILLLIQPAPTQAADACPTVRTAWTAQLDIVDGSGRHYLIDPITQGLPAAKGNVAKLGFASKPDRWLVNGVKIDPAFHYVYHVTYWDQNWRSAGESWFATLPGYPTVYFYFVMPAGEPDHPRCGYGSALRSGVDELFRPRP